MLQEANPGICNHYYVKISYLSLSLNWNFQNVRKMSITPLMKNYTNNHARMRLAKSEKFERSILLRMKNKF